MSTWTGSIDSAVSEFGEDMVLRRRTGTTNVFTDVSVKGIARQYQANELLGGLQQGDERVVIGQAEIAAASWPAPPRNGDLIVYGNQTRTIRGCRNIRITAETLGYDLWVRG